MGRLLKPPHDTTPAAVIANENQNLVPLRAVFIFMRKMVCNTAVSNNKPPSVTL